MHKRFVLSCVAAATVLAAPLASAEMTDELSADTFGTLDVDRDGKLVRSELESFPAMVAHFEAMDANEDGALDLEEFRHLLEKSRAKEKQS